MQGLQTLYDHTGRRAEWKRLVEEVVPDFVDKHDIPLAARSESDVLFIFKWRFFIAMEERQHSHAEALIIKIIEFHRSLSSNILSTPIEKLTNSDKSSLRELAVSIEQLGHLQREQNSTDCVDSYQESISICQRISNQSTEAVLAFNLGHAYRDLPALRNLDEAEHWYRRSLELFSQGDLFNQSKGLSQLGYVEYERFRDAQGANKPQEELLKYLKAAAEFYERALTITPPDALDSLATKHNQLGIIYAEAGDLDRALNHFNNAAKFFESAGNLYLAGKTQNNIAIDLANNGRLSDALLYARAALRNFESYGGRAKDMEDRTKELIADIEETMKK
jgi:tetratricopeptide (TPR) repeat protein